MGVRLFSDTMRGHVNSSKYCRCLGDNKNPSSDVWAPLVMARACVPLDEATWNPPEGLAIPLSDEMTMTSHFFVSYFSSRKWRRAWAVSLIPESLVVSITRRISLTMFVSFEFDRQYSIISSNLSQFDSRRLHPTSER